MIESMGFSERKLSQLKGKLTAMAKLFPDVDMIDLERLDDLVLYEEVKLLFLRVFLSGIDSSKGQHLVTLASLCLKGNCENLSHLLIRYCISNQVITDIETQKDLVNELIALIVHFQLSEYIDIESQSDQVRFFTKTNGFGLRLNQIPMSKRLNIFRLLRDSYVTRLQDRRLVADPSLQKLCIEKYNNLTRLLRALDSAYLEEKRWARIYKIENLEYGSDTTGDLTRSLFQGRSQNPVEFDELLWRNFSVMLFPAFGNIEFEIGKVTIANEGHGCMKSPKLEIWCNDELIAEASTSTVVLAHQSCSFYFDEKVLEDIRNLDSNTKLSFHLLFSKFASTPFKLVRTKPVGEVQESFALRPEEQDIISLAQKMGVTPQRIRELAQTRINTNQDLFRTVKRLILRIRWKVEQDDGYMLLTTGGENGTRTPSSETEVQIALKHWLRPMCKALDIDMNREPLSGRGQLDFKFSMGQDLKCLVEVKLFHSKKLEPGLQIQLPTYLNSENTRFGIYLPVIFRSPNYESKLKELKSQAYELAQEYDYVIEVIDIRAWKPDSASKATTLDEPGRYSL